MQDFLDRVEFDLTKGEILDGSTRYVMLRADVVQAMLHALPAHNQTGRHPAANAVAELGGRSLRRYRAETNRSDAGLREVVSQTAAALGWGTWTFAGNGAAQVLEVSNSPFACAGTAEHPTCHPIAGLFSALVDPELNTKVTETQCVSIGDDVCRFETTAAKS